MFKLYAMQGCLTRFLLVSGQLGWLIPQTHSDAILQHAGASSDSLLKLVSELKQSTVLSDFCNSTGSSSLESRAKIQTSCWSTLQMKLATSLHGLKAHYCSSPFRTSEADAEMFQRSIIDGRD